MSGQEIITHKDIAIRVGCDKSTVSLALRDSSKVAEVTKKRILKVAEELGYRPDPAIAALSKRRWSGSSDKYRATLAYLLDSKSPYYKLQFRHLNAVKTRAEERGFVVEEFDLAKYPSGKSASRVLYNRGIQGVVLPAIPEGPGLLLNEWDMDRFAIVGCSLGWQRPKFHSVAPDVFEGARLTWRKVVAAGYKRIGAVLCRHDPIAVDDYARFGASRAMEEELVSVKNRIPFLLSDPKDEASFFEWFEKYKPEALICFVQGPPEWLTARGFSIPGDVAVACLNVQPGSSLSGVSILFEEVGRSAADFLIAQLADNKFGLPDNQQLLLVEPKWVEGSTLVRK